MSPFLPKAGILLGKMMKKDLTLIANKITLEQW